VAVQAVCLIKVQGIWLDIATTSTGPVVHLGLNNMHPMNPIF